MQQRASLLIAAASFLTGATIFYWGHGIIRNYGGDVVVVIFLYALAGILTDWQPRTKLLVIGGLALAIECAQLFILHPGGELQQATLGAYFDPLDLLAYALGLLIAYAIEAALEYWNKS